MIGVQYQVGSGEVRAAYTTLKAKGVANDATQLTVGYVHNLSKRTALYTNYSLVDNKGVGTRFSVGGGSRPTSPGGNSSGLEFGMRHSF
jgi:predicted porin